MQIVAIKLYKSTANFVTLSLPRFILIKVKAEQNYTGFSTDCLRRIFGLIFAMWNS